MTHKNIFALQAYEKVAPSRTADYEKQAVVIDNQVKDSEPGMLVHAMTKVTETKDYTEYCWLEVFDGVTAFQAHIDNPHVAKHFEFLSDGVLVAPLKLVIYCDWSDEEKSNWVNSLDGIDVQFADTVTSYYLQR